MDDFPGILARDLDFRPQGKAAPMASSRGPANAGLGARGAATSPGGWNSTPSGRIGGGGSLFGDHDAFFGAKNQSTSQNYGGYDDIFGAPVNGASAAAAAPPPSTSSMPVYDKPVYDDEDIFNGIPGTKSTGGVKYDDVFSSLSSSGTGRANRYDDLLGGFGRSQPDSKSSGGKRAVDREKEVSAFDDLIPGFGGISPSQKRETSEANLPHPSMVPTKSSSTVPDDPFVVLESSSIPVYSSSGLFNDPIEHLNNPQTNNTQAEGLGATGSIFDDFDAFEGLSLNSSSKDKSIKGGQNTSPSHTKRSKEKIENSPMKSSENNAQKVPRDDYQHSIQPPFDMSMGLSDSHGSVGRRGSHPKDGIAHSFDTNPQEDVSPKSDENSETGDEAWLTVDEIPLFTQPTSASAPSRPPPSWVRRTAHVSKADRGSAASVYTKRNLTGFSSAKSAGISSIDELQDFAMGRPQNNAYEHGEAVSSEEEREPNSAAASAMKEAMDRAEAKFKHAREVRERERDAKSLRTREFINPEGDEKSVQEAQEQERLYREQEQREMEEKEKKQKRLEREREREQIEKERARQAVERATREARERSAAEARAKHERAAARERERAAVQRAAAEARERLAAGAREKAERFAAEARQKAAAEAREKERVAAEAWDRDVENAAAEVRARAERAKAEQERAASASREKQQRDENDLESFFGQGFRPSSAPRQRSSTPDFQDFFDNQFQSKGSDNAEQRTSSASASSIRKASSATNIVDDFTSLFGGSPSAGEFQEVEGESEERRRARLERHQRTLERAAKALAEKNERDMQTQREQAERHRIAETLDAEIKRWAQGKEGNLRALLSTLQYVLWPDCGWQPVSLTDLITAASVKKVYRKATLCIHPDKVQQKGANLQQKYIAEKAFDLLKEAWNKFNSEEPI